MFGELREELIYSLRNARVRICLGIFAATLTLGLLAMIYWWPVWNDRQQLMQEINERRHALVEANYAEQVEQAAKHASEQLDKVEKRLEASVSQTSLVQHISVLAKKNHVHILSETYDEGKIKDGYLPLVHELTLHASYANLRGFILGLQELPTISIVQEATLEKASHSKLLKAQIRMVTYSRAQGHAL